MSLYFIVPTPVKKMIIVQSESEEYPNFALKRNKFKIKFSASDSVVSQLNSFFDLALRDTDLTSHKIGVKVSSNELLPFCLPYRRYHIVCEIADSLLTHFEKVAQSNKSLTCVDSFTEIQISQLNLSEI